MLAYRVRVTERITPAKASEVAAASEDGLYGVLLRHGSMELGYYCPRAQDAQQPHDQDELYIVRSGSGVFLRGTERIVFAPGDALFVPAGMTHRFVDFSEDLAAWVIFWGPPGGESGS